MSSMWPTTAYLLTLSGHAS